MVGKGEFGPVSAEIWNYEVSGLKVVQSWLGYRKQKRRGKKSSDLDHVLVEQWAGEMTTELLMVLNIIHETLSLGATQDANLLEILDGALVDPRSLAPVKEEWRAGPTRPAQSETLFE